MPEGRGPNAVGEAATAGTAKGQGGASRMGINFEVAEYKPSLLVGCFRPEETKVEFGKSVSDYAICLIDIRLEYVLSTTGAGPVAIFISTASVSGSVCSVF